MSPVCTKSVRARTSSGAKRGPTGALWHSNRRRSLSLTGRKGRAVGFSYTGVEHIRPGLPVENGVAAEALQPNMNVSLVIFNNKHPHKQVSKQITQTGHMQGLMQGLSRAVSADCHSLAKHTKHCV